MKMTTLELDFVLTDNNVDEAIATLTTMRDKVIQLNEIDPNNQSSNEEALAEINDSLKIAQSFKAGELQNPEVVAIHKELEGLANRLNELQR